MRIVGPRCLATPAGLAEALIDSRPHLPEAWETDKERRSRAQIPETVESATEPQIACDLIANALDAGIPGAWVLADALYDSDSRLRRMLDVCDQADVLAVR